ncbi:MAG: hypothetical protein ACHQRK_10305, partial [Gemmatimonadales bacterium]
MQRIHRLLAFAVGSALALSAPADAQIATFGYTNSIVTWTVPTTGSYFIEALGAQGGSGGQFEGGLGAQIGGQFSFTAGDALRLAVGGKGESSSGYGGGNGGGGGGSFVVDWFGNALLIAGGGGGIAAFADQNGCDASTGEYGIAGAGNTPTSPCSPKTGSLGQGGAAGAGSSGSGGAGFYSNGADDPGYGTGGEDWANELHGGVQYGSCVDAASGGFGGGGAG